MTQVMRRMFLVHSSVISPAAKTVDLVMENHSLSDIDRAVIRHLPVLDEEDVSWLWFRPLCQAH
ncbi:Uncharacterised protein [Enterobacter hormaechei]|nr:Uncharacterised protein [Enterobacter hormaechei]